MHSVHRRTWALLLCGLGVQAAAGTAVIVTAGRLDAYAFRSLDAGEYHRLALNLARHGVFSGEAGPPWTPDTWRTPGYPLVLAPLAFVFGESPIPMILFQQILRAVNVCLLYVGACRWLGSNRSFVAALLFLCEPYGIYYSFWLMSETWFITVLLLCWLA